MAEYLNFASLVKEISENEKLAPDLMKSENGNNFRAISESAILDVISPILNQENIYYTVEVKEQHLDIKEAYGSKGKKLQFVATVVIKLHFWRTWGEEVWPSDIASTEAVGMGIDDNDKAMGKAYTYAIKYALLKLFRLRYGDDPDFEASKPLHTEKPKEEKKEETKPVSSKNLNKSKEKKSKSSGMEVPMSEAQRDYILGMMKKKKVEERQVLETFKVEPSRDEFIPMPTARAIIKWLENDEFLPF